MPDVMRPTSCLVAACAAVLLRATAEMPPPAVDVLVVGGESLSSRILRGHLLKGGAYTTCHDHRMVMALKVASLGASSPIVIDDEQCVAKSFPDFLTLFCDR